MIVMHIEYKCRRCGVVYTTLSGGEQVTNRCITNLVIGAKTTLDVGFPPTLLDSHTCKDKGIGISDIIGARKEELK